MTITNPNAAFGQGDNPVGNLPNMVESFALSGSVAIDANDTVSLVYDAATGTLKAEPWDTNASGQAAATGFGVAIEPITASRQGKVVLWGFAEVFVDSATPAEGNLVIGSTTAGVAGVAAADASTVAGTAIGKYLGAKNSDDIAPCWVSLI